MPGPDPMPPVASPPPIPDYELIARIGAGAYGEVWLGRNVATGARRVLHSKPGRV